MSIVLRDNFFCLFLILACLFVYTRGLHVHGVEYRDDEIFYYQSTQEMLSTGNYLSPTYFSENRFQKPILFYWLILVSYKVFGSGWFAARFVAAFFAALSVWLTLLIARELFDRKTALLSTGILMTLPLFQRHAKNAVPDMPMNFFIVLAIYCAIKYIKEPQLTKFNILFFVSCALGFMVKGFAALIFPIGTVIIFSLLTKRYQLLKDFHFGRGMGILLCIILPWFLYMIHLHGSGYFDYMVVDETKGRLINGRFESNLHNYFDNLTRHSVFYLSKIGAYFAPWSIFLLGAIPLCIAKIKSDSDQKEEILVVGIWLILVYLFFSSMYFVISHYMLVLSTPFAILVSLFFLEPFGGSHWHQHLCRRLRKSLMIIILSVGCFAFAFLAVFLSQSGQWWIFL